MPIPYLNAQGIRHVRDHLTHFPRPDRAAADAVRAWAHGRGVDLDPDQVDVVTLHYVLDAAHGFKGAVARKLSLTQALLANWQGEMLDDPLRALFHAPLAGEWPGRMEVVPTLGDADRPNRHQVFHGLFRRTEPQQYSDQTRLTLPAEDFQAFIEQLHLHDRYKRQLDTYWSSQLDSYASNARLNFIAACNKQAAEGSLSRAATRLAWQVAGVSDASATLKVRPLNVYGYAATDLLYFKNGSRDLVVLYIPGNSSPLHEFANEGLMKDWFAAQCKDPHKRAALMAHFALADEPDGLSYSGLITAMGGLAAYPERYHLDANRPGFTAEGYWPPRDYVNYKTKEYSPAIVGDVFAALAQRHRRRSYRDADAAITTDAEVAKKRWAGYLNSAINYLAPLALVVPELAIVFAIGGAAQFGLGLDLAIEGRNRQEKAAGVESALFGALNAAPLAGELVNKAPLLFRFKSDRLVFPQRLNGQLGFALSPVSPPRFAAEEIAAFFDLPDNIAPLPGADPATRGAVVRVPFYNGAEDELQASIGGYAFNVVYDVEADAFISADALNEVDPDYYIASSAGRDLIRVDIRTRPVTDTLRMSTLRALGVDLHLPVELPKTPLEGAMPIPRTVFSLWVGDQVLSTALLDNIAHNTARLAASAYDFKLYLSRANATAYAENLRLLGERAPGLTVLPLEDQAAFDTFRQSAYHAQYQAALSGNGKGPAHYASAADILRYRLLHHEGGLYMDLDDSLKAVGEYSMVLNGQPKGAPGEALDEVALATTPEGLLLHSPVSNEKMRNGCMYNNSLIASHAGNPTLDALSEEMRQRFAAYPNFYDRLPRFSENAADFYRYAANLSYMTGPGLLTDIVDRHLPALACIRQLTNLSQMPQRGAEALVDNRHLLSAIHDLLPLDRIARIGGNQSWAT
ncbi:glycosyltransferase [Pseudomonas entomophila]|uniref:dermonecrotic toxin domain-containing protein n=1 Tax=Pseudomonas entomophila TaxID=312306 RepID=UPI0023D8C9C6|nr:DUF6543 domain-containing protein [Pseudomonas entomophila]MDF0731873.1 glycosyltransferase [Pseudomonas entomophila]